jgi:type I restriction-modification system DNA methylase subunit
MSKEEKSKINEKKSKNVIKNPDALRSHIHLIHDLMRNYAIGYGFTALEFFNFFYGLKLLDEDHVKENIKISEKNKKLISFKNLVKLSNEIEESNVKDDKELVDKIDDILQYLYDCGNKPDSTDEQKALYGIFYYDIKPKHKLKGQKIYSKIIKYIDEIDTSNNHHLAGKVYEYFIGRDESSISSLGAYFTDRHITNFLIDDVAIKFNFINDDKTIKKFCDPFGGSGGFTLSFVNKINNIAKKNKIEINWDNEIKKIFHYDLSEKVIKMLKLELFTLTYSLITHDTQNILDHNSFQSNFYGHKYDVIFSNPPYGGDKNEKTDEQKKIEKKINKAYETIREVMTDLEFIEKDSKIENYKLLSNENLEKIDSIIKKNKNEDKIKKCKLILSLKKQIDILKNQNKEIVAQQNNKCVNYDTCCGDDEENRNGIIRDFIKKYKDIYTKKSKSNDERYKDYNFGNGEGVQYANDKEACSLILLMALLNKGGICAAVLKDGVFFDGKYSFLREILVEYYKVTKIISIPGKLFENTSTQTRCIIFENPKNEKDTTSSIEFSEISVNKYDCDVYNDDSINDDMEIILKGCKGDINDENPINEKILFKVKKEVISKPSITKNKKNEDVYNYNYYLDWNKYENEKKQVYCPKDFELKKVIDICEIKYGTRITKDKNGVDDDFKGIKYPVYGGGNITFYTDNYNRENTTLIISRFALSKECVRLINGKIFLNDSSLSLHCTNNKLQTFVNTYFLINNNIIYNLASGSCQKNLNVDELKKYNIPVPKDMTKIEPLIKKLQDTYTEFAKMREEIPEKEKDIQNKIQEICDNEDCDEYKLGDILQRHTNGKTNSSSITNTGEYNFYSATATNPSGTNNKYDFDGKDYFLFAKSGGNSSTVYGENLGIGKFWLVNGKTAGNVAIIKMTNKTDIPNKYINYYLKLHLFKIQKMARYTTGNGNIDMEELMNDFNVKIPKSKSTMKKLEKEFEEIDKLKEKQEDREKKYQELQNEFKKLFEEPEENEKKEEKIKKSKNNSDDEKEITQSKKKIDKKEKDIDSDKSLDSNIKKETISKKVVKKVTEKKKKVESSSESESESSSDDDFEWTELILNKVKKYLNDEDELKKIKNKYDIPKDIFNDKLKELNKKSK